MGEENEDLEHPETRFMAFVHKLLGIFENVPKAIAGIAIVISLIAGGTGVWGTIVSPENDDVKALQKEVAILKIWNEALRERTKALLISNNIKTQKIEFDGYLLDLDTGKVVPYDKEGI